MFHLYSHPVAAISVRWPIIERQMQVWRRQHRPPIPATLNDFSVLINSQQWAKYREYENGNFLTVHTIVVDALTSVTIIGDPNFLASLQDIEELYIDATFEICPRQMGIYQFLTIMGKIDDTASIKNNTIYFSIHLNFFFSPSTIMYTVNWYFEFGLLFLIDNRNRKNQL